MSIAALSEEDFVSSEPEVIRKQLQPTIAETAEKIGATFDIAGDRMAELSQELVPLAEQPPVTTTKTSNALDALVRFIPTESITLYVAAVAALPALKDTFSGVDEHSVYWFFAALTPVLFVLITLGKRKSAGLPVMPKTTKWPWFKIGASTVAFLVWALAVPSSPYLTGENGKIVAAFGALLVSTVLTLLEPLLTPRAAAS